MEHVGHTPSLETRVASILPKIASKESPVRGIYCITREDFAWKNHFRCVLRDLLVDDDQTTWASLQQWKPSRCRNLLYPIQETDPVALHLKKMRQRSTLLDPTKHVHIPSFLRSLRQQQHQMYSADARDSYRLSKELKTKERFRGRVILMPSTSPYFCSFKNCACRQLKELQSTVEFMRLRLADRYHVFLIADTCTCSARPTLAVATDCNSKTSSWCTKNNNFRDKCELVNVAAITPHLSSPHECCRLMK